MARGAVAQESELSTGDNAWMMTSTALVLFMTAPGLAMFYSGLVRRKNVLGLMMQCLFLMGIMSVVWAMWGYSFAFGGDGTYLGNTDYLFLRGLLSTGEEVPMTGSIPTLVFMLFQGMFFVITRR